MIKFNFSFKTMILALVGVVCLGVTNAEAANNFKIDRGNGTVGYKETLKQALSYATAGEHVTITLLADYTATTDDNYGYPLGTSAPLSCVLDLQTYKITQSAKANALTINGGTKTFTIRASSEDAGIYGTYSGSPITLQVTSGTVVLESGTISASTTTGTPIAVQVATGTFKVNGGTVSADATTGNIYGAIKIGASNDAEVIINGGTVKSTTTGNSYALLLSAPDAAPTATINGGTIIAKGGAANAFAVRAEGTSGHPNSSELTVTGNPKIAAYGCSNNEAIAGFSKRYLQGGYYTSKTSGSYWNNSNGSYQFINIPSDDVLYNATEAYRLHIVPIGLTSPYYEAKVQKGSESNYSYFLAFADAYAYAAQQSTSTIVLVKTPISYTGAKLYYANSAGVPADASLTLDLNGKTINSTVADRLFQIDKTGTTFTITDNSGTNNGKIDCRYSGINYAITVHHGTLVVQGGEVYAKNTSTSITNSCTKAIYVLGSTEAKAIIKGQGKVTMEDAYGGNWSHAMYAQTGGKIEISENAVITANSTKARLLHAYTPSDGTDSTIVTVSGGTFVSNNQGLVSDAKARISIDGGKFKVTGQIPIPAKSTGTTNGKIQLTGGYYSNNTGNLQNYCVTGYKAASDPDYAAHGMPSGSYKVTIATTTVSFNQNGGTGGQTSTKTATYGQAMPTPITLPTKTGYNFGGYYSGSGGTGTQYYTETGASARTWDLTDATKTLYAKWTKKHYTVTLNNQSATTAGTASISVTYDDNTYLTGTPAITSPKKTNYNFGGYYTGTCGTGTQIIAADGTVNANAGGGTYTDASKNWKYDGNITLYAKWTQNVTLKANGGSADGSTTATFNSAGPFTLTPPTRDGYTIEGYYAEAGCTNKVLTNTGGLVNYSGWVTDGKWTRTASGANLYPKWEQIVASVAVSGGATTYHTTIADAFARANEKTANVTITVLQPCTVTSTLTFAPTNAINGTLDLNGKTLSSTSVTVLTVDKAGTTLTVKDSQSGGTMSFSNGGNWNACVKVANGKMILQSGTISRTSTTSYAVGVGIEPNNSSNAELEVTGGKVQATATSSGRAYGILAKISSYAKATISGGEVTATTSSGDYAFALTVAGGAQMTVKGTNTPKISASGAASGTEVARNEGSGSTFTIEGGLFKASANATILSGTISVSGGYFNEYGSTTTYKTNISDKCVSPKRVFNTNPTEKSTYGSEYVYKVVTGYAIAYKKGASGTGTEYTDYKADGDAITLRGVTFTRTGYTQTGWSTTDGGAKAYNLSVSYTSNAAATLYPYWSPNTNTAYKVKHYKQNLAGTGYDLADTDDKTGTTGASTAAVAKSYTGFTVQSFSQTTIAANGSTVVSINYNRNSYTLTWDLDGGTVTVAGTGAAVGTTGTPYTSVKYEAPITVPTVGKEGYDFDIWSPYPASTMPAANATYEANWVQKAYNVTFFNGGHGTIQVAGATIDNGGTASVRHFTTKTLVATADPGYTFAGWTSTGSVTIGNTGEASTTITAQGAGATVTATWVPATITFTGATNSLWSTTTNWSSGTLPTAEHDVIIQKPCSVTVDNAKANSIVIYNNGNDKTGQLIIGPNYALEVTGAITKTTNGSNRIATTPSDLILQSSSDGNASLVFDNTDNTKYTQATVETYSKATYPQGGTATWQYIGVPFAGGIDALSNYYETWLYEWAYDYTNSKWTWMPKSPGDLVNPWIGYCITQRTAGNVSPQGTLNPTATVDLEFSMSSGAGQNMVFANSWTAPIQITQMELTDFVNVYPTIYLFNTGLDEHGTGGAGTAPGTYRTITIKAAGVIEGSPTKISSAQGFYVKSIGADAKVQLSYAKHVRPSGGNTIVNGPMLAPKRMQADKPEVMTIVAQGSRYASELYLLSREDFSRGYDLGWDGENINGTGAGPLMYTLREDGTKDVISAIPAFEGAIVGFHAGEDSEYTFSFSYNGDEVWYLNDLLTETSTLISAETTYTFATTDNDDTRFIISATPLAKTPQGIEGIQDSEASVQKQLINDKLYIIRNGRMYDATGKTVKNNK